MTTNDANLVATKSSDLTECSDCAIIAMVKPIVCAALLLAVLAHPVTSLIEDDLITGMIGSGDVFNG